MGATAVMHAASEGADLAGVVVVSATARFRFRPETDPTRRLKRIWDSPTRRHVLRLVVGVQLGAPDRWRGPRHPVDMVAGARLPFLVVHGEDDAYFPPTDAVDLARAAAGPATLWREPHGFGHAEDGITPDFVTALGQALDTMLRTGRFPDREAVRA
jgi:uncharacterized protein